MMESKASLLIVEDDPDVAEMLSVFFKGKGYGVVTANAGEAGVDACYSQNPDLVLLDIRLPDIDGYEVARRLRNNRRTQEIPIIFLTDKRERTDRLHGLELGADDYVTKPFDVQELHLRVRNAMSRSARDLLTNSITGLPQGRLVDERLDECLHSDQWSILLVSLENLGDFRESYGFVAADDALRAISLMVRKAGREDGSRVDFIGHMSSTQFLLVSDEQDMLSLKARLQPRLESSLSYFYPLNDSPKAGVSKKRLALHFYYLTGGQASFADVNAIKKNILQREV
jgi:DNA-binding response OmpR family regulator